MCIDPNLPRGTWRLGCVEEVLKSSLDQINTLHELKLNKRQLICTKLWGAKSKRNVLCKNMSSFGLFSYIINYLQTIPALWVNNLWIIYKQSMDCLPRY